MRGDVVNDTSPEAERIVVAGFRSMPLSKKIALARATTRSMIRLARADVVERHPNATEREHDLYLASRWLGPEIMWRVYGWDVRARGY